MPKHALSTYLLLLSLLTLVSLAAGSPGTAALGEDRSAVEAVRVAGPITPVVADFVSEALSEANARNAPAFLLQIDTPGGLDSSMRQMIQAILQSRSPVVVYVAPAGARAASAGALIALSADFIAMAPGTSIGAAHPVAIGGGAQNEVMMDKVLNDAVSYARSLAEKRGRSTQWAEDIVRNSYSSSAREAEAYGISDLEAESPEHLLSALTGRTYLRDGAVLLLDLEGRTIAWQQMDWRQEILAVISNPNVAYLLMMLGVLGIFFEISQPGVILPGVLGAMALLLALFGFQALPVNYVGFMLILLAMILFILEVKVVSFGMLTVAGVVAMSLGSLMLMDSHEPFVRISRAIIALTVATVSLLSVFVLVMVSRIQRRQSVTGVGAMVGETGGVVSVDGQWVRVFIHGESWRARSPLALSPGDEVRVQAVGEDMILSVAPVLPEQGAELRAEGKGSG